MKRTLYKLARNSAWLLFFLTTLLAYLSRYRVMELYSSPPIGGSLQIHIDRGGWIVWGTRESIFGNWFFFGSSSYEEVPGSNPPHPWPDSLIDDFDSGKNAQATPWKGSLAGVFYFARQGPPRVPRLGARHSGVIGLLLCIAAVTHVLVSRRIRHSIAGQDSS